MLRAATPDQPPPHVREQLVEAWPVIEEPLREALGRRAVERTESLARRLDAKRAEEIEATRAVLTDLRRTIADSLKRYAEAEQLTFGFAQDERDQFMRDIDSLRARMDAIPSEIEREEAAINERFSSTATWMFPAAVTFLVPRRLREVGLEGTVRA